MEEWADREKEKKESLVVTINVLAMMELIFYEFTLCLAYFTKCTFRHEKAF